VPPSAIAFGRLAAYERRVHVEVRRRQTLSRTYAAIKRAQCSRNAAILDGAARVDLHDSASGEENKAVVAYGRNAPSGRAPIAPSGEAPLLRVEGKDLNLDGG
jgi:hypothetical protein